MEVYNLKTVAAELSIPLRWKLKISSDGVLYIDWTTRLSEEKQLLIENLQGLQKSDQLPLAYRGSVAIDELVPIGWFRELTDTEALAWTLSPRGVLWTLDSRGNLTWVLESRGSEWTLPSKPTGWSANTRITNWTIGDN